MTDCLLKQKRFYCREWTFSKLSHCLETRTTSKTCGVLIVGGPGCGKTALCCETVWPTGSGKQVVLSRRNVAHYFCQSHDPRTLSPAHFVASIARQLGDSDLLPEYRDEVLVDEAVQRRLTADACRADPDAAFVEGVLRPLAALRPPSQNLFIVVDSLDEASLTESLGCPLTAAAVQQDESEDVGGSGSGFDASSDGHYRTLPPVPSRSIAELLGRCHHMFPRWLMLVCTVRKQRRAMTRWFTGFRKVSLDDLRKAHVVRDVQQYIMYRLDAEENLRRHLRKDTAEMFNQLHIKSNGCLLFLEKILDGIAKGTLSLREVREIPGTLNGLYLWLCQRLFPLHTFVHVRPIFEVMLASRRPLTVEELFVCVWTRDTTLDYDRFCQSAAHVAAAEQLFAPAGADGSARIFFHDSFAEWLQDVKHCTQKYHCRVDEGHRMLVLSYTLGADRLQPDEVCELAYHLGQCGAGISNSGGGSSLAGSGASAGGSTASLPSGSIGASCNVTTSAGGGSSGLSLEEQAVWLLYSGACIDESYLSRPSDDPEVNKLLALACAACPEDCFQEATVSAYRQSASSALDALIESLHELNEGLSCFGGDGGDDVGGGGGGASAGGSDASRSNVAAALLCSAGEGRRDAVLRLLERGGADVTWEDELGQTALNLAARNGHAEVLSLLLSHGADVNHADAEGWTALRSAAWGGHTQVVSLLLAANAEVDYADADQRTALRAAAWGGHGEIASMLLACGADVNRVDKEGRTALTAASYMGHRDIVALLLDSGAQVNQCDNDGRTALSVAALRAAAPPTQWSHTAAGVVRLLLARGAAVDHRDKDGATALLAAAGEGQRQLCEIFLDAGADVDAADSSGRTPLLAAAAGGHIEVVELFMQRHAATDPIDSEGRTALSLAAQHGSVPIVRALLDRGMDEMHRDNRGLTALHLAAFEGHKLVIDMLVDIGARLDEVDNEGSTALLLAAQEGHLNIVRLLLDRGAEVNRCSHNGRTPLRAAALKGHVDVVEELVASGADINYRDADGRSTLYVLALDGRTAMAALLLRSGADVCAVDEEGRSALHVACWQGHADTVELLLAAGADVNAVDGERRTALQSACWQGHADIVDSLCRSGGDVNHACNQGATALCVAAQEGHGEAVRVLCHHGADPTYVDKFGRTAAKVAMKGGHAEVCRILDEYVSARLQAGNPCPATGQVTTRAVPPAAAKVSAVPAAAAGGTSSGRAWPSSLDRTLSDTAQLPSSAASHGSCMSIERMHAADDTLDRVASAGDAHDPAGSRERCQPEPVTDRFAAAFRRQADSSGAHSRHDEPQSFVQQLWAFRKQPETRMHVVASEGTIMEGGTADPSIKRFTSLGSPIHMANPKVAHKSAFKTRLPEPLDPISPWQHAEYGQGGPEADDSNFGAAGGCDGRRVLTADPRWSGGAGGLGGGGGMLPDAAGSTGLSHASAAAMSPRMGRRRNGIRTNPNLASSRQPAQNGCEAGVGSTSSTGSLLTSQAAATGATGSLPTASRLFEGGGGGSSSSSSGGGDVTWQHGLSAGGNGDFARSGSNGMASGSVFVRPTKTAKIINPQKEMSPKAIGVVRPTASAPAAAATNSRGKETLL